MTVEKVPSLGRTTPSETPHLFRLQQEKTVKPQTIFDQSKPRISIDPENRSDHFPPLRELP